MFLSELVELVFDFSVGVGALDLGVEEHPLAGGLHHLGVDVHGHVKVDVGLLVLELDEQHLGVCAVADALDVGRSDRGHYHLVHPAQELLAIGIEIEGFHHAHSPMDVAGVAPNDALHALVPVLAEADH